MIFLELNTKDDPDYINELKEIYYTSGEVSLFDSAYCIRSWHLNAQINQTSWFSFKLEPIMPFQCKNYGTWNYLTRKD